MFTFIAASSLLLCATILYLWARSHDGWKARSFYIRNGWNVQLVSSAGRFEWNEYRFDENYKLIAVGRKLEVPYWTLALVTAVLPVAFVTLRVTRWLTRYRGRARCPLCGYDLRASPDRCPECGTAVEPAAVDQPAATKPAPSAGNTR
jgi:hypothetical protein